MIDNLQNNHENFPQILISTNKEIIEKRLFDINNTIITNMNDIFRYFDFEKINYNKQEDAILPFQIKLLKYTINSNSLQTILIKCFIKFIDQEEDFINKIFRKEIFDSENLINMDFMKTFFEYICDLYFQNFRKIVIILEKEQIMTSLLFNEKFCQNEIITKYINDYTDKINNKENNDFKWDDKILNKKYQIQILFGLKFPFVKNIFNHILTYASKNISSQFLEEDTNFLYRNISIDYLYERQEKYMKNLRKLNKKLYLEVKKYVIVLDILRSKNKELISNFFNDLFFVYIQKNTKLKNHYSELVKILDLMLQIRLKTRMNDKLSMDEFNNNFQFKKFIDIIEEEIREKNKNIKYENMIQINLFNEKLNKTSFDLNLNKGKNNEELIGDNIYINKFLSIVIFLQS